MPANSKILFLRELLAARGLTRTERVEERLFTHWPAFDDAIGNGLPKGDITELHCAVSGGALSMARIIEAVAADRHGVGLIDGADSFDPASVEAVALTRLLWVRCRSAAEAVKAADLVLRDGNLPLVLLNLRGCADATRVPSQTWYRLQRIVEQSGVALVVLTPCPLVPSARVRMTLRWRFQLDDLDRAGDELAQAVTFETTRVQGTRGLAEEELPLAEVC